MIFYADILLDDFLVAENSPYQPDMNSPVITSERALPITSTRVNQSNVNPYVTTPTLDSGEEILSSGGLRY
jgi:protein phosphatase